jgi:hypothetical protein
VKLSGPPLLLVLLAVLSSWARPFRLSTGQPRRSAPACAKLSAVTSPAPLRSDGLFLGRGMACESVPVPGRDRVDEFLGQFRLSGLPQRASNSLIAVGLSHSPSAPVSVSPGASCSVMVHSRYNGASRSSGSSDQMQRCKVSARSGTFPSMISNNVTTSLWRMSGSVRRALTSVQRPFSTRS